MSSVKKRHPLNSLELAFASHHDVWFGVLIDDQDDLVASAFSHNRQTVRNHLVRYSWRIAEAAPREVKHQVAEEMVKLYKGEDPDATVSLNHFGVSKFQKKVYDVLKKIPRGRVTNYGLVARAIGSGPRAVGNAVGSNPWPLFVPCHRVVPSNMSVGNYSMIRRRGRKDSIVKKMLLEREGVRLQGDRISPTAIWNPR